MLCWYKFAGEQSAGDTVLTLMSSWSKGTASSASSCTEESALTVIDPLLTVRKHTHSLNTNAVISSNLTCKIFYDICDVHKLHFLPFSFSEQFIFFQWSHPYTQLVTNNYNSSQQPTSSLVAEPSKKSCINRKRGDSSSFKMFSATSMQCKNSVSS